MEEMISVITVTWNAAKHIKKCMDSVNSQIGADFEHIIIDGRSEDDTVGIVKANLSPITRLIENRDKWIYEKMNDGILAANGEWLYFLSADDVFTSEYVLRDFTRFVTRRPDADILYGNIYCKKNHYIIDGEFSEYKLLNRNIPVVFYKKTVFAKVGNFNTKYRYLADYEFNLRSMLSGKLIYQYIPLVSIFYADGGVSSIHRDEPFKRDYQGICIKAIMARETHWLNKLRLFISMYYWILVRKCRSLLV